MAKKTILKYIFTFSLISLIALSLSMFVWIIIIEMGLPDIHILKDVHMQQPLQVFTQDKKLIAEFGQMKRIPITLEEIPKQLIEATIATEDQRFFEHAGVDFIGLGRATLALLLTGKKHQGASTITMQVARNFFLSRKKTYMRKIREILLALKIERELSKNKILELYFNKIFYGHRSYGIAAAAQVYYGKTPNQLTLPEIAMLTGLPKAPSALNPITNPEAAKKRRSYVLKRMYELEIINQNTCEDAITAPITANPHSLIIQTKAPYVAEMVRQMVVQQFGEEIYGSGNHVYTTIDSKTQAMANRALKKELLTYDQRHGYRGPEDYFGDIPDNIEIWKNKLGQLYTINSLHPAVVLSVHDQSVSALLKNGEIITLPWEEMAWARKQIIKGKKERLGPRPGKPSDVLREGDVIRVLKKEEKKWQLTQLPEANAALVALDPQDGAIKALVGGFDFFTDKFNRVTQAERQPGSSFKPFLYSAALEKGMTLATIINDAPVVEADSGGTNVFWRPENDSRRFYGPTRLRTALTYSRNLVSIRILQTIGIPYAIDYFTRFGFNRETLPRSLSLSLGSNTLSPLELATGYAVFANGGYQIQPYFIDYINDEHDKRIMQTEPLLAGNPISEQDEETEKTLSSFGGNTASRVISPQNVYLITSVLQEALQQIINRKNIHLNHKNLAGKTGTTNDRMDAWFCGFDSHLVTATWLGFNESRSLGEYGAQTALPMWADFMNHFLKGKTETPIPQPTDIVTARIDKTTGLLASDNDENSMFELFRKQYVPTQKTPSTHNDEQSNNAGINQLY